MGETGDDPDATMTESGGISKPAVLMDITPACEVVEKQTTKIACKLSHDPSAPLTLEANATVSEEPSITSEKQTHRNEKDLLNRSDPC